MSAEREMTLKEYYERLPKSHLARRQMRTIIDALSTAKDAMVKISHKGHKTGYDWNEDKDRLTLIEGDACTAIDNAVEILTTA